MDVPFSSISVRSSRERKAWTLARVLGTLVLACSRAAAAAGPCARNRSSKRDPGSPEVSSARWTNVGGPSSSARRVPDALKFANGLLRQKKYDLAAEEYERFANSGAKGKRPG